MNERFEKAWANLRNLLKQYNYALTDFLPSLSSKFLELEIPELIKADFSIQLAEMQKRLSLGSNEQVHLLAIVGIFFKTRDEMRKYA